MAKTNLTPDQKRGIWRAVLAFLKLILHIGEKHVHKHVIDNAGSSEEGIAGVNKD